MLNFGKILTVNYDNIAVQRSYEIVLFPVNQPITIDKQTRKNIREKN